jgi:hypothetical protein
MKKDNSIQGWSSSLNTAGVGEVIITYEDGEMSSEYISEYDVLLSSGEWKCLRESFRSHDLVTDNTDVHFREPASSEERVRGWYE